MAEALQNKASNGVLEVFFPSRRLAGRVVREQVRAKSDRESEFFPARTNIWPARP
jgi:hypothetical protein